MAMDEGSEHDCRGAGLKLRQSFSGEIVILKNSVIEYGPVK